MNETPRRRPGRPRGGDSSVTHEHALRVAFDLISAQGYAATSMAQVANAAGLSNTGLIHHFNTKQALLAAVLKRRDEIDIRALGVAGPEPWGAVEQFIGLARANTNRPQLVRLFVMVTGEAVDQRHPAHQWMLKHYDQTAARMLEGLRADQAAGHIIAEAPLESITRTWIALWDGLQIQWLLDPALDMVAELERHLDALKRRWGAPNESGDGTSG